jgi:translation elongation factor EF-1alpha
MPRKTVTVEPGPPPTGIPSVEEPARNEEALGTVTHYYSHLGVAIVQINKNTLSTGDIIHIKGHTTDFTQKVESMEYEHQHLDQAGAGQSVGIKIKDHAREHDIVYRVK